MQLPPLYIGKWATASEEEVQEELAKGTPFTYRFRVPKEGSLTIDDLIRGEVRVLDNLFSLKQHIQMICHHYSSIFIIFGYLHDDNVRPFIYICQFI